MIYNLHFEDDVSNKYLLAFPELDRENPLPHRFPGYYFRSDIVIEYMSSVQWTNIIFSWQYSSMSFFNIVYSNGIFDLRSNKIEPVLWFCHTLELNWFELEAALAY